MATSEVDIGTSGSINHREIPNFDSLPLELYRQVLSLLPFQSAYALRLASKKLCFSTSHADIRARRQIATELDLLDFEGIEESIFLTIYGRHYRYRPHFLNLLPCYVCNEILPKSAFSKTQLGSKRGLNQLDSQHRFCKSCGRKYKNFTDGMLPHSGVMESLCRFCDGLLEADGSGESVCDCFELMNSRAALYAVEKAQREADEVHQTVAEEQPRVGTEEEEELNGAERQLREENPARRTSLHGPDVEYDDGRVHPFDDDGSYPRWETGLCENEANHSNTSSCWDTAFSCLRSLALCMCCRGREHL